MILKAGTYRFNDSIPLDKEASYVFNATFSQVVDGISYYFNSTVVATSNETDDEFMGVYVSETDYTPLTEQISLPYLLPVYTLSGWFDLIPNLKGEGFKTFTVAEQDVTDECYSFITTTTNYNEVNKPLAEITYNGATIAQLNAGETCTLKCAGLPMETDIIVKVNG